MKPNATWDVVAMAREAPILVATWAAWHLELGAARVHLFFHDPTDLAADLMERLPQVSVYRCSADHWQAVVGRRPPKHQTRQMQNATYASQVSTADWILHADCDEFLWPERPPAQFLGAQANRIGSVRIQNIERYWQPGQHQTTLFDGAFRAPADLELGEGMAHFGADYAMTMGGLTAHRAGKCFSRIGRGYRIRIHKPVNDEKKAPPTRWSTAAQLLHFDGITPMHWALKVIQRASSAKVGGGNRISDPRAKQVEALVGCHTFDDVLALHDRLKCPTPAIEAELQARSLSQIIDFDPTTALARWVPEAGIDLRPELFDDWLRAQSEGLLDRFGV